MKNLDPNIQQSFAYSMGEVAGALVERAKIETRIEATIKELRKCRKKDNCKEIATLIESHLYDWMDK